MTDAATILSIASGTLVARAKDRDVERERAMAKTVAMFNAMYPDSAISEEQGWAFMIFLKLARSSQGRYREDDYVDLSSYAALMGECASKEPETAMTMVDNLKAMFTVGEPFTTEFVEDVTNTLHDPELRIFSPKDMKTHFTGAMNQMLWPRFIDRLNEGNYEKIDISKATFSPSQLEYLASFYPNFKVDHADNQ